VGMVITYPALSKNKNVKYVRKIICENLKYVFYFNKKYFNQDKK